MNLLLEFLKYKLKAKGRHGTHSPFIYSFVNECLTQSLKKQFISDRKFVYKQLATNNSIIEIKDYGVGSKKMGNHRKISTIFKTSSSIGKYGDMLYKIALYYQPKNILEFGTSLGIGTLHLYNGNKNSKITTVEACPNTLIEAKKNLEGLKSRTIHFEESTFQEYLNKNSKEQFDVVFIDGHHDGKALKHYLKELKPQTHNDTIFILDDIRWSDSMLKAWNELIQDKEYRVSIDLFRIGILIPRKQQEKEHFVIKL